MSFVLPFVINFTYHSMKINQKLWLFTGTPATRLLLLLNFKVHHFKWYFIILDYWVNIFGISKFICQSYPSTALADLMNEKVSFWKKKHSNLSEQYRKLFSKRGKGMAHPQSVIVANVQLEFLSMVI